MLCMCIYISLHPDDDQSVFLNLLFSLGHSDPNTLTIELWHVIMSGLIEIIMCPIFCIQHWAPE